MSISRQQSSDPTFSRSNPFDSDSDSEMKHQTMRISSAPVISKSSNKVPPIINNEDECRRALFSSSSSASKVFRSHHKNELHDIALLEDQSLQELENYAVYKAEETTEKVNNCLKIAEDIREDATKTLVTLHQQGEQITRTHLSVVNIEPDLSRAEKLLGSLGGIFSRTWKPKKNHAIRGPTLSSDGISKIKASDHTERSGISPSSMEQATSNQLLLSNPKSALEKVEVEKAKQDDALSDLSNLLGQLKEMAVDMGSEIESQNTALGHLRNDVDEVHFRVKGANVRTRRLLGK